MKKFVCSVCGYVYEGEQAPEFCPQCKAPREKFIEKKEGASFACEHEVGVAQGIDKEVYDGLDERFDDGNNNQREYARRKSVIIKV